MKLSRAITILLLGLTFVGAVAWFVSTPASFDDYIYRCIIDPSKGWKEWSGLGDSIETFDDALVTVGNHFKYCKGRLSNVFMILTQPIGTGFCEGLVILSLAALLILLPLASVGRRWPQPLTVVAMVMLFGGALPWYNMLQSLAFRANYVIPSATFVAMLLLLNREQWKRGALAALMLLAFLTAWLHESFGIAAGAYVLVLWLMSLKQPQAKVIFFCGVSIAAGFAINLLCGTLSRASYIPNYWGYMMYAIHFHWRIIVTQQWPEALALLFAGIVWFKYPRERKQTLRRWLPMFIAMLPAIVMAICLDFQDRIFWANHLMSIIIISTCLDRLLADHRLRLQSAIALIFSLGYIWWLTELVVWEQRIAAEMQNYERLAGGKKAMKSYVLFAPFTPSDSIPGYLNDIVLSPMEDRWGALAFTKYFSADSCLTLVLPDTLAGKPFEQWPAIPGNNDFRGVWPMIGSRQPHDFSLIHASPDTRRMLLTDRLLYHLGGQRDSVVVILFNMPVILADGDTIYRHTIKEYPRSFHRRTILSVDSVSL